MRQRTGSPIAVVLELSFGSATVQEMSEPAGTICSAAHVTSGAASRRQKRARVLFMGWASRYSRLNPETRGRGVSSEKVAVTKKYFLGGSVIGGLVCSGSAGQRS